MPKSKSTRTKKSTTKKEPIPQRINNFLFNQKDEITKKKVDLSKTVSLEKYLSTVNSKRKDIASKEFVILTNISFFDFMMGKDISEINPGIESIKIFKEDSIGNKSSIIDSTELPPLYRSYVYKPFEQRNYVWSASQVVNSFNDFFNAFDKFSSGDDKSCNYHYGTFHFAVKKIGSEKYIYVWDGGHRITNFTAILLALKHILYKLSKKQRKNLGILSLVDFFNEKFPKSERDSQGIIQPPEGRESNSSLEDEDLKLLMEKDSYDKNFKSTSSVFKIYSDTFERLNTFNEEEIIEFATFMLTGIRFESYFHSNDESAKRFFTTGNSHGSNFKTHNFSTLYYTKFGDKYKDFIQVTEKIASNSQTAFDELVMKIWDNNVDKWGGYQVTHLETDFHNLLEKDIKDFDVTFMKDFHLFLSYNALLKNGSLPYIGQKNPAKISIKEYNDKGLLVTNGDVLTDDFTYELSILFGENKFISSGVGNKISFGNITETGSQILKALKFEETASTTHSVNILRSFIPLHLNHAKSTHDLILLQQTANKLVAKKMLIREFVNIFNIKGDRDFRELYKTIHLDLANIWKEISADKNISRKGKISSFCKSVEDNIICKSDFTLNGKTLASPSLLNYEDVFSEMFQKNRTSSAASELSMLHILHDFTKTLEQDEITINTGITNNTSLSRKFSSIKIEDMIYTFFHNDHTVDQAICKNVIKNMEKQMPNLPQVYYISTRKTLEEMSSYINNNYNTAVNYFPAVHKDNTGKTGAKSSDKLEIIAKEFNPESFHYCSNNPVINNSVICSELKDLIRKDNKVNELYLEFFICIEQFWEKNRIDLMIKMKELFVSYDIPLN